MSSRRLLLPLPLALALLLAPAVPALAPLAAHSDEDEVCVDEPVTLCEPSPLCRDAGACFFAEGDFACVQGAGCWGFDGGCLFVAARFACFDPEGECYPQMQHVCIERILP